MPHATKTFRPPKAAQTAASGARATQNPSKRLQALQRAADDSENARHMKQLQRAAVASAPTRQLDALAGSSGTPRRAPVQLKRTETAEAAKLYNENLVATAVDQARKREDWTGAEILADIEKNNASARARGNKVFDMMYDQHARTRAGAMEDTGGRAAGQEFLKKLIEWQYFWAVDHPDATTTQVHIGRERFSKWGDAPIVGPQASLPEDKRKFVFYSNYVQTTGAGTKLVMNENFKNKDADQEAKSGAKRPVVNNSDIGWIARILAVDGAVGPTAELSAPVAVDIVERKNIKNVPTRDVMWMSDGNRAADTDFRMGEDHDYRTLLGSPNVSGVGYSIAQRALAGSLEYLMGIKRTPTHNLELSLERYKKPPEL